MNGFIDRIAEKLAAIWLKRVLGNKATTAAGILSATGVALGAYTHVVPVQYQSYVIGISAILGALAGAMGYGPEGIKKSAMILFLGAMLIPMNTAAQDVTNLYGAGVAYSVNASPSFSGSAFYARNIADSHSYAYTNVLAVPTSVKPFQVSTNIGVGIAQKFVTFGTTNVYCDTTAGPSWTGSNFGWQYNGSCFAPVHVKKSYYVIPLVGFLKSSVSNGSGYQPVIGIHFGWGN